MYLQAPCRLHPHNPDPMHPPNPTGLAEVTTLATALGAHPLTMLGLGGIGDLVLTCTGDLSRNRTVGLRIGKGEKLADITASMGGAHAEGVLTSRSACMLARRLGLDCATIEGIYRVLYGAWGRRRMGGGAVWTPGAAGTLRRRRPATQRVASLAAPHACPPLQPPRGRRPAGHCPREHEPRAEARGAPGAAGLDGRRSRWRRRRRRCPPCARRHGGARGARALSGAPTPPPSTALGTHHLSLLFLALP
jgi:hypothetical protein